MRFGAALFSLVACGAGFALAAVGLGPALGLGGSGGGGGPHDSRLEIKFAEFAARKDEFDTLFLGSSRTFRGFDPQQFDELTAAGGRPTRSFNFGVPGMRAMEIDRLLERVDELAPAQLRWIFVDPEGLQILLEEQNALAREVIDWHDPTRTRLICTYALTSLGDTPSRERATRLLRPHVIAAAYHLAGVGRGLTLVDRLLGQMPDPAWVDETLGPRRDGFVPYGSESAVGAERGAAGTVRRGRRHRRFLRQLGTYEALLEDYRASEPAAGAAHPQALQAFESIAARVEALGARIVFVTQPGLYYQEDLIRAAAAGEVTTLLRFDQPAALPELYDPAQRWDPNHLNHLGAALFTELLAAQFLQLDDAREGPR